MPSWTTAPIAVAVVVVVAGCAAPMGDVVEGCRIEYGEPSAFGFNQTLVVRNLNGGGRVGPTASQDFPFVADQPLPWECVVAVEVTISWVNTAAGGADLYVGVEAPAAQVSAVGRDTQQLVADGRHGESVTAPVMPSWADGLAEGLTIVVYSDWASLSASGLPVQAVVMFTLDN